jgi:hypothetical protein
MARSRKTATPEITVPTVTDDQYKELLAIRLTAMHGFAEGTVDEATMKLARAAIRKARKVRKAEAEILEAYREHLAKKAAEAEAAKATRTRKPRTRKPAEPRVETPEPVVENETETPVEPKVEIAA